MLDDPPRVIEHHALAGIERVGDRSSGPSTHLGPAVPTLRSPHDRKRPMTAERGNITPAGPGGLTELGVTVLIPIKAFHAAKQRLSPDLDPSQRSDLARWMAAEVIAAAAPLPVVVVCDDPQVREWAERQGASICWTPGLGLNGALEHAAAQATDGGAHRLLLAHADLPFARDFGQLLGDVDEDEVVICPDRHRDGTNVMSVPTAPFRRPAHPASDTAQRTRYGFAYGPGSFRSHAVRFATVGLRVTEVTADHLSWDVDRAADLDPPSRIGSLPSRFQPRLKLRRGS